MKIRFEMDMPLNCYECPMCYETEGISFDSCQLYYYLRNKNDNFKNKVFEQIKLPLFRIRTTSNYQTELEKIYSIIVPKKQEDSQQ